MGKLLTTETLPETGCTRQDIYDLIETSEPTAEVADLATVEVLAGKLYAMLNVPRWVKVGNAIAHTALQAAALTNDIELFVLPAKGVIHAVKIKHSVAFSGGAISNYLLSVGVAGTLAKYAAPYSVFGAVAETAFGFTAQAGAETHNASGKSIRLAAESVGANLNASAAGTVDVWVLYSATL